MEASGPGRRRSGAVETVWLSDRERVVEPISVRRCPGFCRSAVARDRAYQWTFTLYQVPPEEGMEITTYFVAGIDVHKRMLAVVVADAGREGEFHFEKRKFGATASELKLKIGR